MRAARFFLIVLKFKDVEVLERCNTASAPLQIQRMQLFCVDFSCLSEGKAALRNLCFYAIKIRFSLCLFVSRWILF